MKENPYIFDAENTAELARLTAQDQMLTLSTGGIFSGIPSTKLSELHNVLDLGCGPGGWVLDAAFEHPGITASGVDISRTMVAYANARALSMGLINASFGVMDITQPLDFADASFDLVNARLLIGSLLREVWPPFLRECRRLLPPGGMVRLTEPIDLGVCSSQALDKMNSLLFEATGRAGYGFPVGGGRTASLVHMLPRLLRQAGFNPIDLVAHSLEFSAETDAWAGIYHNFEVVFRMAKPFLVQEGVITEQDFEKLYQHLLIELNAEDFCGVWSLLTVVGTKPTG